MTDDTPMKTVIDCTVDEASVVPLTAAEQADVAAVVTAQKTERAAIAARKAAVATALTQFQKQQPALSALLMPIIQAAGIGLPDPPIS